MTCTEASDGSHPWPPRSALSVERRSGCAGEVDGLTDGGRGHGSAAGEIVAGPWGRGLWKVEKLRERSRQSERITALGAVGDHGRGAALRPARNGHPAEAGSGRVGRFEAGVDQQILTHRLRISGGNGSGIDVVEPGVERGVHLLTERRPVLLQHLQPGIGRGGRSHRARVGGTQAKTAQLRNGPGNAGQIAKRSRDRVEDLVNDRVEPIGMGLGSVGQRPKPERQERADPGGHPDRASTPLHHRLTRNWIALLGVSMRHGSNLSGQQYERP